MKNLLGKFLKEEEGNIIEYIIVLAVIAVVIAALFPDLQDKVMGWFKGMIGNVDNGIGGNMKQCVADGTTGTVTEGDVLPFEDMGTGGIAGDGTFDDTDCFNVAKEEGYTDAESLMFKLTRN